MHRRFDEEDYQQYKDQVLYGRVRAYDTNDGYGYIYSEIGKDVFLSSYAMRKKNEEKKLRLGTVLTFKVARRGNRYAAIETEISEMADMSESICLPNGHNVRVRNITKYGYASGKQNLKHTEVSEQELVQHGYKVEDLDSVYLHMKHGDVYTFYRKGSPLLGDGYVENPKAYIHELDKMFLYL